MTTQIYHFPSNCERILKRENFSLEDLLDEDEIVIDVKEGKEDIIEYLLNSENLNDLVEYLVNVPTEETPNQIQFRYPLVAFEILTSDIEEIGVAVVEDDELLEIIISYFEQSHQNTFSRRITLVAKLVLFLYHFNSEKMTRLIIRRERLIPNLLLNLNISGYVSFITSLIQEDEIIVSWLLGSKFVTHLFENFSPTTPEKHSYTATAILEILEVVGAKSRFVAEMNSKDNVTLLCSHMFAPNNCSAFLKGLSVIQRLLSLRNSERQIYGVKKETPLFGQAMLERIPELIKILQDPLLKNVSGEEPFGALRLSILRVIKILIEGNFPGVQEKLLNSKIFEVILHLFPKFPKNNLFHSTASVIFILCLQQRNAPEIIAFLKSTKLVEYFISTEEEKTSLLFKHWFHIICRVVVDRSKRYMEVQEFLETIGGWLDYSSMITIEKNKEDLFDRERLKEEGENTERPEAVGWSDDDVGIQIDFSKLTEDVDIDSRTDTEEYELNETEMSVSKFEIENFGLVQFS